MKVLCIISSFDTNKTALVKRGSIYNITNIIRGKYNKKYNTDIWYELLETGKDLHLGALFVLAPIEENNNYTKIKNNININS